MTASLHHSRKEAPRQEALVALALAVAALLLTVTLLQLVPAGRPTHGADATTICTQTSPCPVLPALRE